MMTRSLLLINLIIYERLKKSNLNISTSKIENREKEKLVIVTTDNHLKFDSRMNNNKKNRKIQEKYTLWKVEKQVLFCLYS